MSRSVPDSSGAKQDDKQKPTSPNPRDSPQNRNHNDFQTGKSTDVGPENPGDCSNDSRSSTKASVQLAQTAKDLFGCSKSGPEQKVSNETKAAPLASHNQKEINDTKGHFGQSTGPSLDQGSSGAPADDNTVTSSSAVTAKDLFQHSISGAQASHNQKETNDPKDHFGSKQKETNDPKDHFGSRAGLSSDQGSSGSFPTPQSGVSSTTGEQSSENDSATGQLQSETISEGDKSSPYEHFGCS